MAFSELCPQSEHLLSFSQHEESLELLLSLVQPPSTREDGWGDRTAIPELWCLPGSSEVCVNPVLDNRAGQNLNTKYFS